MTFPILFRVYFWVLGSGTVFVAQGKELCGDQMCKEMEICDSSTNTCMVRECGHPGKELKSKGNMFSVGSKSVFDCAGNSETLTCMSDGSWQNVKRPFANEGITCKDIRQETETNQSGVYRNSLGMNIYCDFDTEGGDWMVFQRRSFDFTMVDFNRTWLEYKNGFGDICGEYWLGLDKIYQILVTTGTEYELRIDMMNSRYIWNYAIYNYYSIYNPFKIDPESGGYRLHVGSYSGIAGNALGDEPNGIQGQGHNGEIFSTWDKGNRRCAETYGGGWWYRNPTQCYTPNLNSMYKWPKLTWEDLLHLYVKNASMKFREA